MVPKGVLVKWMVWPAFEGLDEFKMTYMVSWLNCLGLKDCGVPNDLFRFFVF